MDLGFVATSQPALTQALSTHRDQDGSYSDLMIRYATSHLPERSKSRFVADKFIRYFICIVVICRAVSSKLEQVKLRSKDFAVHG